MKRPSRRWVALAAAVVLVAASVLAVLSLPRGPSIGPMAPQRNVLSFGFHVPAGTTFSWVVWLSAARPVTVTLEGVALRDADPGLELVGSGILRQLGMEQHHFDTFPPGLDGKGSPSGDLSPLEGSVVTTGPNDSRNRIALGIRVPTVPATLSATGVWIDYEVDGSRYRTMLPWLLNVCTQAVDAPCDGPDGMNFTFPPEFGSP